MSEESDETKAEEEETPVMNHCKRRKLKSVLHVSVCSFLHQHQAETWQESHSVLS